MAKSKPKHCPSICILPCLISILLIIFLTILNKEKNNYSRFIRSDPRFAVRASEFFGSNRCESRFFMTWIARRPGTFGERESYAVQSLFKSHPNACLLIVSDTVGAKIIKPFAERGYRIAAMPPDFGFLFAGTGAADWLDRLSRGDVDPGEVRLGQNLSNLLRLGLLYRFGGVYVDTDVILLKQLSGLRNVIGAQSADCAGNWTRLNNAVLVFDRAHPLLREFIEEFASTFDGNRWGHNGPYLVSRVVERVVASGSREFEFGVMPPAAFYPVDWNGIRELFRGVGPAEGRRRAEWVSVRYKRIRRGSFALHLWNRQSRGVRVEAGSVIAKMLTDCCVLRNSSQSTKFHGSMLQK